MASYHLTTRLIGRSKGQSAVASAAYRSRSKMRDVRLDQSFDFSKRMDLAHAEIMLPKNAPKWMENRSQLWNTVEKTEKRKDARLSREVEIALPIELKLTEQIDLVKDFCKTNFIDHGMVADICIHDKKNNPHAHIMLTTRDIDQNGFGKKNRDWDKKELLLTWREEWARIQNFHLAKAGFDISVDHRSYEDRNIPIVPQIKIGAPLHFNDPSVAERVEACHKIARENGDRIINDPDIALNFLTEQQATFSRKDIYRFVHSHTDSEDQFYEALKEIEASENLVHLGKGHDGDDRFTSKELLTIERDMLDFSEKHSGENNFQVGKEFIDQAKAIRTLSEDQEKAFDHIMNGGDYVSIVGHAGTGKSYMLGAVREAYESDGYEVMGMALSGIAAQSLKGSGIDSTTIHKRLWDWDNGNDLPSDKTVIVVDESGMVGTRLMHRINEHAQRAGAKVILSGDFEQVQPIEAGGASRAISERIGYAEMTDIRRQEVPWQKEATMLLSGSHENIADALDMYDRKDRIRADATIDEAKDRLIGDWEKHLGKDERLLIFAFQNKDVNELNHRARIKMIQKGLIKEGKTFSTSKGRKNFSVGDRIIFLDKERFLGIENSTTGTIEGIRGNDISVRLDSDSEKTIVFDAKKFNRFDHGYAVTVHKSQGATVDRSFVLGSKYFDKHMSYVSLSRHRKDARLYVSNDEHGFKDFAHMKLLMGRRQQKQMIHEFGQPRGIEVDLQKIYKWQEYELKVTHGERAFNRKLRLDPRFSYKEGDQYLKEKLQEYAAEVLTSQRIMNYKDVTIDAQCLEDPEKHKLSLNQSVFNEINQGKIKLISDEMDMLENAELMAQTYTHGTSRLNYISVSRRKKLSQEQHDALKYIVSGGDMVSLAGYSGTGKSYVLSAVKDTYEAMGYQVIGVAETAMSAGNMKRSSGIEAQTIRQLSAHLKSGKVTFDENTVLVMDEAGSINSKEMAVLIDAAEKSGSKMVLSSNPDQRQPFEPSSAARSIHKRIGGVELKEVLRQKVKWQQKATRLLSGNYEDVAQAINIYDARGKIQMKDTLEEAKKALVTNWSHRQDAVMIAFRNKDVTDLNTLARALLYQSGKLKGKSQTFDTVKGSGEFCEGDKVLFLKDDAETGITAGSFARIEKIEHHKIHARMDSGAIVVYDTSKYKNFTHGYAMGLNSTQNIEVGKTLVLGTRHFDKHLSNLALSRHTEDTTLYVSRDEDGFKDHAHMKLLMARNREKPLMSEADTVKAERMDLSRIYKWDQYEIRFGLREKEFKKNLAVDPCLSYQEQRKFLENKAKEFAAETVSRYKIKNYSGYSINVDPVDSNKKVSLGSSSVVGLVNQGTINLIAGERGMIENAEIMAENDTHRLDRDKIQAVKALKGLSKDQEKAFDYIVGGGDMVAITGHSGSGKSYLLGAVKEAYEQNDYTVLGVAASNIGAGNMKHVSGIESQSIYHFLKSVDSGKISLDKKMVLIVDEANSIDVKTMSDIVGRVEASGAKFVLSSNLNQKQPMEAGGAARSLSNAIGHQALTQVQRQSVKWQKEATQLLSGSYEDVVKAVSLYDENDKIHMEESLPKAKEELISAWEGKDERTSLILALRKEDVSELNELAREALYRSGKLKERGTIFNTSMGKAHFSNMDRIVFLKDDTETGVSAGRFATIEKIMGSKVSARLDSGKIVVYDAHKYTNFTHGYAVSLNNAENIDAKNTFVLGTRHFDRHLANLALTRHKEDMKLYVSRDEMGFKDFAHMKLLMSRSREKSLISEIETVKKEPVDIGKIYRWDEYQVEVSYGIQTYRKTIKTDSRLKHSELRDDLGKKARSFAEKIAKQNKKDMSMMKIKVEYIDPVQVERMKAREIEKQKGYSKERDDGPSL